MTSPENAKKSAPARMTHEEFRNEVLRRGWTYRALAARWEVTENWVSKIARNTARPQHWDDAVRGLPLRA